MKITFRHEFHVFAPHYLQAFTKLTRTLVSNIDFLKCILIAEELSLSLAKMRACFDEVHGVQSFGKLLKIGNSLRSVRHNPGSWIIQIRTRNKSFISVPLPGPVSMILTPVFVLPWDIHSATIHKPTSSPKTWDISGDVIKSPFRPNWSLPSCSEV